MNSESRSFRLGGMLTCIAILSIIVMIGGCSKTDLSALPAIPQLKTEQFEGAVRKQIEAAAASVTRAPGSVRHNGRLAMILQTYKQFAASEVMYQRVRALDPGTFKWSYLHGIVLGAVGQPEAAVSAFRAAIELDDSYPLATVRLAEMLADLGETDEAREYYLAVRDDARNLSEFHFSYGRFLLSQGDADAAIAHIRDAMRLSGEFGAAHYQLGIAFRSKGELDRAEHHLTIAEQKRSQAADSNDAIVNELLELNRNDQPFVLRAKMLAEAGRFDEARQFVTMALERNPESVPAYASLIAMATHDADYDAVDEYFNRAIELDPLHPKVWFNLGIARMQQRRFSEAAEAFEKSRSIDATDPNTHFQLVVLAKERGADDATVEAQLREVIRLDPTHQFALWLLGELLAESGRPAEGISHLERAVLADHDQRPRMLMALATARARISRWDEAFAALDEAEAEARRRKDDALLAGLATRRATLQRVQGGG